MKVPVKGPCFLCEEQYYARLDRHFMRMHPHYNTGDETLIITDNNKPAAPNVNKKSQLYPKTKEGQIPEKQQQGCYNEEPPLPKRSTIVTHNHPVTIVSQENQELSIEAIQPFKTNGFSSQDGKEKHNNGMGHQGCNEEKPNGQEQPKFSLEEYLDYDMGELCTNNQPTNDSTGFDQNRSKQDCFTDQEKTPNTDQPSQALQEYLSRIKMLCSKDNQNIDPTVSCPRIFKQKGRKTRKKKSLKKRLKENVRITEVKKRPKKSALFEDKAWMPIEMSHYELAKFAKLKTPNDLKMWLQHLANTQDAVAILKSVSIMCWVCCLRSYATNEPRIEPDLILNVFRGCDTKIISTIGDKLHKVIFKEIIPLLLRNPHILKKSYEAFTKISDEEKIVV